MKITLSDIKYEFGKLKAFFSLKAIEIHLIFFYVGTFVPITVLMFAEVLLFKKL